MSDAGTGGYTQHICPPSEVPASRTMSRPRDYSSQSYSPSGTGPSKSVPNANKSREKDDMVGLNDKFVQLIDKVCIMIKNCYVIIIII